MATNNSVNYKPVNNAILIGSANGNIASVLVPSTANRVLLSGASTAPSWSTATYPASTTINTILYSSAANTIGQITAANNGVLISSNAGVPSFLANSGTAGFVLTANSGSPPSWKAAPSGITNLNGDTGSSTGSTITFTSTSNSGKSTGFSASGSQITLNLSSTDGNNNTFLGNSSGGNTASGMRFNTSLGYYSLQSITVNAASNTAIGYGASSSISQGYYNTCLGASSLSAVTTGYQNIAIGISSGGNYASSENNNIVIGNIGTVSETNVLRIGANSETAGQSKINSSYICGIKSSVVTGSPVLISSSDQLGVASSSARFKNNIVDMEDTFFKVSKLRPVNYIHNKDSSPGLKNSSDDMQYGLIAEEVHEVFPYLCNYDDEGKPFSVKYDQLPSILLNELQKANKRIQALEDIVKNLI